MISATFESATPPDGDATQREATPGWVTGGKWRSARNDGGRGLRTWGVKEPENERFSSFAAKSLGKGACGRAIQMAWYAT
jgi:hypothetical protein